MHEALVNCLFKLAQEKVWLGDLTIMTISVDLGCKATKQTNKIIAIRNLLIGKLPVLTACIVGPSIVYDNIKLLMQSRISLN